jgi:gamma-glutamyltranspeptidase/glutathione hydrolase
VSQVLLAVLDYLHTPEVDLQRIVSAPRYHHQFWPDRVEVEPQAFGADWRSELTERGHRVQSATRAWGNMQAVYKAHRSGLAQVASDPRGEGLAWY